MSEPLKEAKMAYDKVKSLIDTTERTISPLESILDSAKKLNTRTQSVKGIGGAASVLGGVGFVATALTPGGLAVAGALMWIGGAGTVASIGAGGCHAWLIDSKKRSEAEEIMNIFNDRTESLAKSIACFYESCSKVDSQDGVTVDELMIGYFLAAMMNRESFIDTSMLTFAFPNFGFDDICWGAHVKCSSSGGGDSDKRVVAGIGLAGRVGIHAVGEASREIIVKTTTRVCAKTTTQVIVKTGTQIAKTTNTVVAKASSQILTTADAAVRVTAQVAAKTSTRVVVSGTQASIQTGTQLMVEGATKSLMQSSSQKVVQQAAQTAGTQAARKAVTQVVGKSGATAAGNAGTQAVSNVAKVSIKRSTQVGVKTGREVVGKTVGFTAAAAVVGGGLGIAMGIYDIKNALDGLEDNEVVNKIRKWIQQLRKLLAGVKANLAKFDHMIVWLTKLKDAVTDLAKSDVDYSLDLEEAMKELMGDFYNMVTGQGLESKFLRAVRDIYMLVKEGKEVCVQNLPAWLLEGVGYIVGLVTGHQVFFDRESHQG